MNDEGFTGCGFAWSDLALTLNVVAKRVLYHYNYAYIWKRVVCKYHVSKFCILLVAHLGITPVSDQLDALFFYNTFISILYMFRAT